MTVAIESIEPGGERSAGELVELTMRYLEAYCQAALLSITYRAVHKSYQYALFAGPWIIMPDNSLVKEGDGKYRTSSDSACTALLRDLHDDGFWPYFNKPVSGERRAIYEGESVGDIRSRLAFVEARDNLHAALDELVRSASDLGKDVRSSQMFPSLSCVQYLNHQLYWCEHWKKLESAAEEEDIDDGYFD